MKPSHKRIASFAAAVMVSASVIAPQIHLAQNPLIRLDLAVLLEAVVAQIVLATVLFLVMKMRLVWFAFMAYIWSATDDAPVYLDSIFTWPEVTSGFQHLFLEAILHLLTLMFLSLTILEAFKMRRQYSKGEVPFKTVSPKNVNILGKSRVILVVALTLIAFVCSYAQNLPIPSFKSISGASWYGLDIIEHVISIVFLYAAIRLILKIPPIVKSESSSRT